MQIYNKRAKFDYLFLEKLEAGITLKGEDVKALKEGRANLRGSYAKIIGGEAYLVGATIPTRKLLLHKKEIVEIEAKMKIKKLTLVPVKLYTKGRLVKVELALSKAKRKFEKKESIKKRDLERELRAGS